MNVALTPLSPAQHSVPLEHLARDPHLTETEKTHEAARQFEAVLLRQILANARKTVIESDDGESSDTTAGIYQDMINNQLAEAISHSGSFGLARSLEVQLIRAPAVDPKSSPAAVPTDSPTPLNVPTR